MCKNIVYDFGTGSMRLAFSAAPIVFRAACFWVDLRVGFSGIRYSQRVSCSPSEMDTPSEMD